VGRAMSAPTTTRRRWPSLVLLALVFLSGSIVGGGVASVLIGRRLQTPDEDVDVLVADQLGAELDLSPAERGRLRGHLSRRRERLHAIREEAERRQEAELDGLAADLGDGLRPDKAERLEQKLRDMRQRLHRPRRR